jgi:hypothetical protein
LKIDDLNFHDLRHAATPQAAIRQISERPRSRPMSTNRLNRMEWAGADLAPDCFKGFWRD